MNTIQVLDIMPGTTVDGPGLRTSIYVAGCRHMCKGCHNPQSWDFNSGIPMTVDEIMERITEEDFNVTLTGGDPLWQASKILPLAKSIKEKGYTLWCYTGFTWEEILKSTELSKILPWIDVIVDGRFIEELRDTRLRFRGSSNQRIIDVQASLTKKELVIHIH
ncbi:MAG: anaerobic ribonucleoside-triphosphate reductase activating protein [Muribaculaceae bacterium]|nr:anaerobic ribonucleoside-triphosphate reductase activating protein [Muribaculaceae bacterium]